MKVMIHYFAIMVFLLSVSCSTAQSKKDVQKETDEKALVKTEKEASADPDRKEDTEEDKESEESEKSSQKKKETDKEKKEKKEKSYFDGNRYKGPALKEFVDGLGHYFSDGCEKAVETWKKAYSKDKNRSEIAFNIGICYDRSGNLKKSKEWYIRSFKANRNFMKPLYNYAISIGDGLKSEKDFLIQLVDKTEDQVQKNNFLSWLHIKTGNLKLAEEHAKISLKQDEQNVNAVVSLATIYHKKEMFELADMALKTAAQWNPDNFRLQRLYGFNSYAVGNKGKANEHFQKAVKINPELPEVRNMLAVLAMEIEDYNTAKEHLEFALKIKPDFISAKINLAIAYKGLEKFKESRAILMELEKDKNLPPERAKTVMFNLGILYLDADIDGEKKVDRFDLAVEYFNRYLSMIKKDKNFRQRKSLIDEYIKEAGNEKKRLELFLRAQERIQAKKEAMEKEHQLFLKNKEEAFKKAVEADNIEEWSKYLENFPVLGPEDKFSNAANARLEELKQEELKDQEKKEQNNKSEENIEKIEKEEELIDSKKDKKDKDDAGKE